MLNLLKLTDERWKQLDGSYGGVEDLLAWLHTAYDGKLTSDLLGNVINEVQHQGGSSSAMYAVAPHLIELSIFANPDMKLALLAEAGVIFALAEKDGRADCPDFIEDGFLNAAPIGAKLIAPLLNEISDFQSFQWGVAGLAGFLGYTKFARFLGNLDFYKGEFHYSLLNQVIPVDP